MHLLGFLLGSLLIAQLNPGYLPQDIEDAAEKTADKFVAALLTAETDQLVELCTDPFTFEGKQIKGKTQIKLHWLGYLVKYKSDLKKLDSGLVEVMDYKAALKRFSKPPKKFSHLRLQQCRFAAVSFEHHNGIMLILSKNKKKDGWLVTAVTD
ncbi:MAG: hypothetical protein JRJ87_16765 [Deltaproteobacteria bacterium]|nr:hypothetical protein [Deltaproteobacteria bacterium]